MNKEKQLLPAQIPRAGKGRPRLWELLLPCQHLDSMQRESPRESQHSLGAWWDVMDTSDDLPPKCPMEHQP